MNVQVPTHSFFPPPTALPLSLPLTLRTHLISGLRGNLGDRRLRPLVFTQERLQLSPCTLQEYIESRKLTMTSHLLYLEREGGGERGRSEWEGGMEGEGREG